VGSTSAEGDVGASIKPPRRGKGENLNGENLNLAKT
jgi:hypothetical protein